MDGIVKDVGFRVQSLHYHAVLYAMATKIKTQLLS